MQQNNVPPPAQHYKQNQKTYHEIAQRLDHVKNKFMYSDNDTRRAMLRTAHRFAVLSIQAPVERHEAAFKQLEGMTHVADDPLKSLNYWKQKINWINSLDGKTKTLDNVTNHLLEGDLDKAHKKLIDDVKGVSTVKAAFMLAMLGFKDKMCVDTNVQQATGIDQPYDGIVVEKYEKQCEKIIEHFKDHRIPTTFKLSPFMIQWAIFDYQRGEISKHQCFFDAIEKK